MKVSDLLYSEDFDVNTKAKIFAGGPWNDGGEQIATFTCGEMDSCTGEPLDNVIDSNIMYVTVDTDSKCIIIECDVKIEKRQKLEISKMLTLSTAHVTQETMETLKVDGVAADSLGLPVFAKTNGDNGGDYGVFIYIVEDCIDWDKIPEDLKAIIKLAQKNGCGVICLDRDGNEVEGFPVYEWD